MKLTYSKDDDDKLFTLVKDAFSRLSDPSITIRERIWFRNILYYLGEQWLEWIVSQGIFKKLDPSKWQATPVTNIIRDHVRSMKALVLNKDFTVKIWPNSEEQEDADAAKMGEYLLQHMDAADDEVFKDETERVTVWMIITGMGLIRTIPVVGDYDWGIDYKTGEPLTRAEVMSFNCSVFDLAVPALGDTLEKKPWFGLKGLKDKDWLEDTFHVKVNKDASDDPVVNYEKKLSKLVATVSPWKGTGLETMPENGPDDTDQVILKEFEFRPTKDMPNGRYVGYVGDQKIFDYHRMPIKVEKNSEGLHWYYSITDYHYHYVPGRYWADAGVDDLISPQNTINEIDADLAMNRKSLARPLVMLGSDANIKRVTKYGQHLMVLKYDPLTSGGVKPEVHSGTPYPSQVLEERNIHRAGAQDVAGDPKNVLRGNAPSSNASGIMVDILRDAAEQGHFPDILRFYRSHKRTYRKRLLLASEVFKDERMIKISGRGHGVEVKAFKAAELRGNTDVRLELANGIASTRVGQTQMMLQLTEAGFFSSQSDLDPEYREELLKRLGLSGFKDKTNTDVARARMENTRVANTAEDGYQTYRVQTMTGFEEIPYVEGIFLSMGDPMEPVRQQEAEVQGLPPPEPEPIMISEDPLFGFDQHSIHYEVHRKFILSPEFRNMPEDSQSIMIGHATDHKFAMELELMKFQQEQMMQQQQAAAAAAPPGPVDVGGQSPAGAQAPAGPEAMLQ